MRTIRGGRAEAADRPHPHDVVSAMRRMVQGLPVSSQQITTSTGHRVHVLEAGSGAPALFLHGTNTSSVSFVPLLRRLAGLRVIAADRPGRGLSDPVVVPRAKCRDAAVAFVDDTLDALGIDAIALVGQSGGGVWALWYAMARPERVRALVLLGSVPLLPGTRCPAALQVLATPVLGPALARATTPSPRSVIRMLSSIGEGDTITRYPDLIDALVAGGKDPVARAADLAELRAWIRPFGFRRAERFTAEQLRTIHASTLLIWGDRDPVGSVDVARAVAGLLPNGHLQVLPVGHVPQLGEPDRVAALISEFLGRTT